jgi:hypothetical protein
MFAITYKIDNETMGKITKNKKLIVIQAMKMVPHENSNLFISISGDQTGVVIV